MITGTLTVPTTSFVTQSLAINIVGTDSYSTNSSLGSYGKIINFVPYQPGYVAVSLINNNPATPIYLAAAYGNNMVTFSNGMGTVSPISGADYSGDQYSFPTNNQGGSAGGLIYMPYGSSGTMLITTTPGGFTQPEAPSSTDGVSPPFLLDELTYQNQPNTGNCPTDGSACERLIVDQSYVNGIALLASTETIGAAAPNGTILNDDASFGVLNNGVLPPSTTVVLNAVANTFAQVGAPWVFNPSASPLTQNLVQETNPTSGNITQILAPITVQGTSYNPFPSGYYNDYNNALWAYLADGHTLYVDASGVNPGCVLQGNIVSGLLVFTVSSGTCPATAESTLTGMTGSVCGSGANELCADGPSYQNGLKFEEFNDCDYLLAAGNDDCHPTASPTAVTNLNFFDNQGLWGPNGTYRAVIGRAIASYQAIGLLPDCEHENNGASYPMNSTNAAAEVQEGETGPAFKNPSCLTAYTDNKPTYNVYVRALAPYVSSYTYSYGDFLQSDGTITYYRGGFTNATDRTNLPYAQPVTITLY